MPIDARDCYAIFSEEDKCDGVPSNALNFLDIVGPIPFALELTKRKSLLEQFGSKTTGYNQMGQVQGPEQSETTAPKTDSAESKSAEPPRTELGAPSELPVPKLELENRLEQFLPRPEQAIQSSEKVDDLVQKLPDHPIREVARSLLKGLFTGEIDRQQVREAMAEFAKAYKSKDINNLPPVDSDDFPLGDASEISLRLRKASIKFNDALTKLGLKMEVIDEKGIIIHNRKNPPINIGVRMTGEIDAFQGRIERGESRVMLMQDAIAALRSSMGTL